MAAADFERGRRDRFRKLRLAATVAYSLVYLVWTFHMVDQWRPFLGLLWVLPALAVCLSLESGRVRRKAGPILAGLALIGGGFLLHRSWSVWTALAFSLGTLVILASAMEGTWTPKNLPTGFRTISLFSVLYLFRLVTFFYVHAPENNVEILRQAGVSSLYAFGTPGPLTDLLGKELVYALTPGCRSDVFFVATRSKDTGLTEFHPETGEARTVGAFTNASNVAVDCESLTLYAGDKWGDEVIVFDLQGPWAREKSRIKLSMPEPLQLSLAEGGKTLFVTTDKYSIHRLDPGTREEKERVLDAGKYHGIAGRYVLSTKTDTLSLFSLEDQGLKTLARMENHDGHGQGQIAGDPRRGRFYVNQHVDGEILILSLPEGGKAGVIKLEPGLRYLGLSPEGRVLVSVEYYRGDVFLIDPENLRVLKKINIGPRACSVSFSRDGTYAFVPSSAGGFRISLRETSGEGPTESR